MVSRPSGRDDRQKKSVRHHGIHHPRHGKLERWCGVALVLYIEGPDLKRNGVRCNLTARRQILRLMGQGIPRSFAAVAELGTAGRNMKAWPVPPHRSDASRFAPDLP